MFFALVKALYIGLAVFYPYQYKISMPLRLVIFLLFSASALLGQQVRHKTIKVHPYLSLQNYEHFKRLILDSPDSEATHIEGFDFKWGYTYHLQVKETKLPAPLSDGTRYIYSLEKIVSQTKAPDTAQFQMHLDAQIYYHPVAPSETAESNAFQRINDSLYTYHNLVEIEVPTHLRTAFLSIVRGEEKMTGTFRYVRTGRVRLWGVE